MRKLDQNCCLKSVSCAPEDKASTKEQIAWMRRLREEGYYVVLAYGAEQAITAILEYISLKKGEAIEHVLNGDKWLYAA